MMDTGVDAPRVVNLVFFKIVRSVSKFWQMIGRGTRLCPNLFTPGEDKTQFLIFDYCENFEFFDEHPDGVTPNNPKSLQQQIFEGKLRVAHLISELTSKSDSEQELQADYLADLHKSIADLDKERFVVRKELRYVTLYADKNKWLNLSKADMQEIRQHLSHLQTVAQGDDELARRFDVLILNYQSALLLEGKDTSKFTSKIYQIALGLQKKDNIPQIKQALPLIKELQIENF
jgi:type I restriction enzyme R subunit